MRDKRSRLTLLKPLGKALTLKRLVLFLGGLLTTCAVALLVWIVLSLIARAAVLPVSVKVVLLVVSGAVTLAMLVRQGLSRLIAGSTESVAVELETHYPDLKGRLIAAVQFARMKDTPGYSVELMTLATDQARSRAETIDFNRVISSRPLVDAIKLLVIPVVLTVLILLIMPGLFSYSYKVYSHPTSVIAPPLAYRVNTFPGSVQWIKYRDIDIGAAVVGQNLPDRASIYHRLAGGSWQQTEFDLSGKKSFNLTGDSVTFSMTLRQINRSFDYYVQAGRVKSEVQHIDVVDRPRVAGIKLSFFYPDYTGLPPVVIDENNGSFSAVVGTRVNLEFTTNLPVQTARLVMADSSRRDMTVTGREASLSIVVDTSLSYHVELIDNLGEKNPDPIEYYVTAIPDEYPSVDIVRPGFDVNLSEDMLLPLKVHMFDDFGFSSLALKYTIMSRGRQSEENVAVIHYSDRIKTEGEVEFNWDMEPLDLYPGDYTGYYFEVADNDVISGPKISRSRQYVARLPSLDEIIADAETRSAQRITETEQLLRTGRDLSQRLRNLARKLQAETNQLRETDWQHQKELESVLDKSDEMIDQVEQLAEQMEKSVEDLSDKALLSREIIEKLMQVQKLFEEVATPEMKQARQRLMEALENMDPQQLQEALNDFQISQEEMLERLERTLALLKKLQLQQAMETLIRQAEQLARRQEDMNEQAASSASEKLPALNPLEKEIKDALDSLKQQVAELDQLAAEAELAESPEFSRFQEAARQTRAGEHMENMAEAMSQKDRERSDETGKQALSALMQMLDDMQQAAMAMQGGQDEKTAEEMRSALKDANYLSQNQEELLGEAAALGQRSMLLRDLALSQQELAAAVEGLKNRIQALGQKSPFVAAEIHSLVNSATQYMDMAQQEFDAKNGPRAQAYQREAMYNLNRASIRLMESLNQQQQSQNAGSCSRNTSTLQSLSAQQNSLNQQTQQAMGQSQGESESGDGAPGREMLQRLAGEQGSIRKSVEQLNREFAGSRQILGRLDDIAREMQEVEEALESGEVGSEIVEKQLKIYSRMLEASRSLYRKDFSEQRQSKPATGQMFQIPPELSPEIFDDRLDFEDRLRRYLGDNYPAQYQEQIKAYFRALLRLEQQAIPRDDTANDQEPGRP